VLLLLGATGCSHKAPHKSEAGGVATHSASAGSPHQIPVGSGPQATYQVAAQPTPGSCHYRYTADKQPLPDLSCTPGATSPAVTQANIADTICKPGGYTSAIRPAVGITGKEKAANAASYGYTGPMGDAEYDHLISLQLGGDPNDPRNLWVEPPSPDHIAGKGPNNPKDTVETHLHTAICKGQVKLADAQQAIATDWTTAEATLGIKGGGKPGSSDSTDADGED
jgi:hypothetical protein